jgi:aminoglycoside phosphotransferase (APT) family kinase protein
MGRIAERTELVSHCDYYRGNVVFRDGLPVALIDFDIAHPTTRLYDMVNALWYWAPLRDPLDRAPAFADADIPHRLAVFADGYGMSSTARSWRRSPSTWRGVTTRIPEYPRSWTRSIASSGRTAPRTNYPR